MFLGPNFKGDEPKFLTQFLNLHSLPDMWESLVAVGRATSEITRWKKKYQPQNDGLSSLS